MLTWALGGEKGHGLESSLGYRVLSLHMPVQFDFSPVAVYFGRVFAQGPRSRTLAAGFLNAELAHSCCRF